jgi:hypothetical protein
MGCLLDEPEEAYTLYRLCQRSLTETLRPLRSGLARGEGRSDFRGSPRRGWGRTGGMGETH